MQTLKLDLRRFNAGTKIGRLKCWVIPGIASIHIGLKDITRFQLEPVVTALGQRLLAKEDVGVFEEGPGYQCFPVSIEETVEQRHSPHPDPEIEALINRFIDVFADKLDGNKPNALPPFGLKAPGTNGYVPSYDDSKTTSTAAGMGKGDFCPA